MSFIKLTDVSLDFIVKTGTDSIKTTVMHMANRWAKRSEQVHRQPIRNSSFRALNNINLNIGIGDRLGLLGCNGAGKSTLLRVLAKVYQPNVGQIEVDGSISSLFDVHLGMNVEATGYENIINLSILRGIPKKEAKKLIPDVEAFTELGDFLNHPVRTYSTGMQMKLAFAVSTAISSKIMLIDEIIGVGDMHFMEKATQRLEEKIENTHIMVLTSHSNDIIKRFCNKVVVLEKGEIKYRGAVDEGIKYYETRYV